MRSPHARTRRDDPCTTTSPRRAYVGGDAAHRVDERAVLVQVLDARAREPAGREVELGGDADVASGGHHVRPEVRGVAVARAHAPERLGEVDRAAQHGTGRPAETLVAPRDQLAADQAQAAAALVARRERPADRGGPVGARQAVGVGAGEQLGPGVDRRAHAGVGGGAGPLLRLVDDAPPRQPARRRELLDDRDRRIRRPVVDEDHVEVGVALGGERLERRPDAGGLVVDRDDDGEACLRAHSRTATSPRLMPPASPISSTREPGLTMPRSRARCSCSGSVTDARLP